MELVDFLRARLDEDEEIAKAATQGDWVWSREFVTPPGYHHRTIGPLEPGDAAYIAHHAPARALAEVEAMRAVVGFADTYEGSFHASQLLPKMAAVYRDHPDFDPAWLED